MLQGWLTRALRGSANVTRTGAKRGRDGTLAARARRTLIVFLALMATLAPALAAASPICDAINAGALNQTTVYSSGAITSTNARETNSYVASQAIATTSWSGGANARFYNGGAKYAYTAGEVVNVTMNITNASGTTRGQFYRGSTATTIANQIGFSDSSTTISYTLTGTEYAIEARATQAASGTGTVALTATCTPLPPTISGLSPTSGPTAGGTSVTISGTNLLSPTAVTFGGAAATVNSSTDTALVVTTPSGSAGAQTVQVTTAGGSASSSFTYIPPPTVTSVSPIVGPSSGGTSVIITGTGFSTAAVTGAVKFGAAAATYTIDSNTQITAISPANAAGAYDITVANPGGTSATSASDQFTYVAAPTVTAVSPVAGPTGGGTTVTITGTGFSYANPTGAVMFGAATATYTINSNTQITATAPANAAGAYDVTVTNVGGTSATSASDQYTYVSAPTVTAVSPVSGPTGGGQTVTITGTGFLFASPTGAVKFGAANATYTINSNTQITATSPANAAGTYDVTVVTPGGTSAASAADQYTYVAAPTVTSVSPVAGPTSGGQAVTITGTGFLFASPTGAVKFGATSATYTIDSNTQISATSPAHVAGTYNVTVLTAGGTSATSAADEYTYVAAPTVTSVSPATGPTGGGQTVTIAGTGFSFADTTGAVKFGAIGAAYTINSNTQITATSPASSIGTYDVTVVTPGGTSATGVSDQYTYVQPPIGSSQTFSSIVGYNDGSNQTTNIDLSLYVSGGAPTSYAVGSATTAQGGSVSVNSSGVATYTPPVGYRNDNDSFTYTATNGGGTSAPATVTVTVGNPTITVTLPSSTATVERVYNAANSPVTFSGGRASYTVNSVNGLPNGLTYSAGVISGTPSVAGNFNVTFNVTDSSLGAGPYNANVSATLAVGLPPAPVVSDFSISGLTYNSGSATATTFSAAPHATESPTSYQVGPSSYGATVSVDSAGLISYTPPVGFRGTDTVNYTATNAGGPSNLGQISITVNDPVFAVALPAASGTVGVAYNSGAAPVTMSGGKAPYGNFSAAGLPAGLTMNSSGVITGTPTTATTTTVVVTATDSSAGNGSYTSTASATLTIAAPTITLSPAAGALPGAQAGVAYGQSFTATGGVMPLTYGWTGSLPNGLTLSTSGVLSGTPTRTGTFNFDVTATDSSGNNYARTESYSVTVSAPSIVLSPASGALTNGEVGQAYPNTTVTATGGTAGYTFSVDSGALPDGVTIDPSSGVISGTPTEGGSFSAVIKAQDSTTGGSYSGTATYSMSIAAPVISISPGSPLPIGGIASPYSQTLTASGGTPGYTFALVTGSGNLPAGLTLSGATISGTPTQAGTFGFTIQATDSSTGGGTASGGRYVGSQPYSLTIGTPTLSISPGSLPNGQIGQTYTSTTISATGGTAPYSYVIDAGALPLGVSLNPSTGVVSGMPTQGGPFSVTVLVNDSSTGSGAPFTATKTYSGTIAAPVLAIAPTSLPALTAGIAVNQTLTASGGTAPYSWALATGSTTPAGVTLSAGGVLSGAPTAVGPYSFTVEARDASTGAGPYTVSRTYSGTVAAPTLSMSPTSLSNGQVGQAYTATITASGGTAPYSFATAGPLPSGLTLSSGGVISGSPTQGGSFNFTVVATDSTTGGSAPYTTSLPYTLTVGAATISITPTTLPTMTVAATVNQTLTASGGVGPYSWIVSAGTTPAGLTLSPTGVLSGVPTASGPYSFSVRAQDSSTGTGPYTVVQAYSGTIGAPTLTVSPASPLPTATQFVAYSQAIVATGGTAPYSYSRISGTLPNGLTLDPTGLLSGTPTQEGSFDFTVRAMDSTTGAGPYQVDTHYTLVVDITLPPTASAATATVGANSSANVITPTLGGGPATTLTIGATPVHGTASVSGLTLLYTPTAGYSGTDSFTYTASNGGGTSSPATVSITVSPPTLAVAGSPGGGTVAVAYAAATFTASAGTAPYTFTGAALPPGLTLSTAGVLSGTPTAGGTFGTTITATDAYGATGSALFSIVISAPTMTVSPTSLPAADYGTNYSQTFHASGGLAPYTYVLTTGVLPTGMTLNASTGELSGAPTEDGTFPLTITATDSAGGSGPFSAGVAVTLSVNAAPPPVVDPTNASTDAGEPTDIDVSSLIDGFYDTVVIVSPPQHGTAVVITGASRMRSQGSGTVRIRYTPNPGYYGPDQFTYAATGPGGASAPAAITMAVAAPAPVVVDDTATTNANAAVAIPVTTNDTGPISTIAIATAPSHGTATVSALSVTYTPAENFFGTDTFTYTATGEGGTGGPATVTVTVNPLATPTQTAQVITVLSGQSATLAATQGATGSPFTGVTVATAPTKGSATVSGLNIVYTPAAGFSGADAFTYRINNPFGASDPVPVTVTVNPMPLTAPPITVEILAGQKAVVNLVAGASGGPFTGAAVASITPADSGAAVVTSPAAGAYTLTFTPDNAFAGTAVVTYTLSNAFATSAPGRINVIVTARPDPSKDPEVKGLVAAQDAAAVRFADAQISNFNRRLEQLHNGGGAGRGFGVSVSGGSTVRDDGMEARERFRKYASLGMNDAADPSSPLLPAASADDAAPGASGGEDGQAGPKRWGVWAAGSADFGMRDTLGSQSGFRFTTDGLTGGVDYRVNDQFAFGLGLGYGRDSSRVGKNGTKSRAESYSAGLYATLQPGENTFVDGVLGYGTLDFDTRRYVTTTGELVNGERDGDQVFASLTFGVERRTQTSLLSPYGRVAYSRSVLDAFSETGGGPYGLTYHAQTVRSLTGTLGLRGEFARKTAAGLLAPRFRVEYSHDFEKINDALLSYTDWVGGPIYRLAVDPIDRDQLRLELGADLTVKSGWRFGLDFDNMVSKDSDSQGVRLTVQSPF